LKSRLLGVVGLVSLVSFKDLGGGSRI